MCDSQGSYAPMLLATVLLFLIGAVLPLSLGRYPDFAAKAASSPA
ncbi:MAG: hypothetical protein ACOY99_06840 [Pseudomonadota bacterium]